MAAFLLLVGPLLDSVVTQGEWVFNYEFGVSNVIVILATCVLAIGVNLSQFACLGRFTAVAYQVCSAVLSSCVSPRMCCDGGGTVEGGAMGFGGP